ncbi:MAG: hypothetical protein JKX73_03665, partial [Flavobacteriales bacterium]|nr:hypothetical protein [Flavobacteriales bacterium]
MTRNKYLPHLVALYLVVHLCACQSDTEQVTNDAIQVIEGQSPLNDRAKGFTKFEDASEFLPNWSTQNVLVFHILDEPDNLHPTNGKSRQRALINEYIHMHIMANDLEGLSLRPGVVRSLPKVSEDQLEFTYELREEPTWDNGQQLSVEDIVFTLKANKCPLVGNPHVKPYLASVKDVISYPDNLSRFTVIMKSTYVQNISFLTAFPIIQRSYFDPEDILGGHTLADFDDPNFVSTEDLTAWASEFNDAKYGRDPAYLSGLGAYEVVSWEPGQTVTIKRKSDHWTQGLTNTSVYETSYPEKIIFKLNKDRNSQMLEFKSQALDASVSLSTQTLLDLQQDETFNKNYHSGFVSTFSYSYAAMNMQPDLFGRKKFFTDKKVRRAMALLTPVDDIIKVVKKGVGERIVGPVSALKPDHHAGLEQIPYDVEQAKTLLQEAGWVDSDGDNIRDKTIDGVKLPFVFELNYMTVQVEWKDIAQMIAEGMIQAGVKVELRPLEFAALYEKAFAHDYDMMLGAWSGNSHPDDHSQIWHTSAIANGGMNFPGFGNVESDRLIDSLNVILDPEMRKQLSHRFQEIVYAE